MNTINKVPLKDVANAKELVPLVEAETIIKHDPLTLLYISQQEMIVQKALFHMRTYEDLKCYYVTFKPLKIPYAKDKEWFEFKGIDKCRKTLNEQHYYITREINASKVHINMVVYSSKDLVHMLHEKPRLNKYFMSCSLIEDKHGREKVVNYITKESKTRVFKKYLDYIVKI